MGLDMYINHTNRTNHSIEEMLAIENTEKLNPDATAAAEFLPLREYEYLKGVFSIFHQGAYWRKANAVHGWFVEKVQKGTDDCGYYELTREHLEELKKDCEEVIKTKNTKALQPQSGFFFGSTAIDEGYWADLKSTVTQINKILKMNWDTRRFFYHSSW
jgi:hypothetical protein